VSQYWPVTKLAKTYQKILCDLLLCPSDFLLHASNSFGTQLLPRYLVAQLPTWRTADKLASVFCSAALQSTHQCSSQSRLAVGYPGMNHVAPA
jgi:hypothetical protein